MLSFFVCQKINIGAGQPFSRFKVLCFSQLSIRYLLTRYLSHTRTGIWIGCTLKDLSLKHVPLKATAFVKYLRQLKK